MTNRATIPTGSRTSSREQNFIAQVILRNTEVEEVRRERDEARAAAREIVSSLELVLDPAAAAKIWARAIAKWPWMENSDV